MRTLSSFLAVSAIPRPNIPAHSESFRPFLPLDPLHPYWPPHEPGPPEIKLPSNDQPDWDDTLELESGDTDSGADSWWGQTRIVAVIRDARRQRVDPRKVFNTAQGGDDARSLKFPAMVEARPRTTWRISNLMRKMFRPG